MTPVISSVSRKHSAVLLVVLNVAQAVSFQMWLGKPLLCSKENSSQHRLAQTTSMTSEPSCLDEGKVESQIFLS